MSYHDLPGLNWSTLRHLRTSPMAYRHAIDHPFQPSAAMQFGTLVHALVLEPDTVASTVAVYDGTRRGKAWDAFRAEHNGKVIVKPDEFERADAAAQAVRADPQASRLLDGARAEVTLQWEERGRAMKGRADILTDGIVPVVCDLKVTGRADRHTWPSHVARMGYHGQLAHYAAGVEAVEGVEPDAAIITVSPEAPHDVAVWMLTPQTMAAGRALRSRLLDLLAACEEGDTWPGVAGGEVMPLDLPRWALGGEG